MKMLMRTTDVFRVDSEIEAAALIEEFKEKASSEGYDLTKYESKYRNKKAKGEIVDEWFVVTLQKDFAMEG
jgi:hypothetical protein